MMADAGVTSPKGPRGGRQIMMQSVDLVFQRANMADLQSRATARDAGAADGLAARTADALAATLDAEDVTEDDPNDNPEGGDGGTDELVIAEWVGALVRLGWAAYPENGPVGARLAALVEKALIPATKARLEKGDPMEETLARRRVIAVLEFYDEELARIFVVRRRRRDRERLRRGVGRLSTWRSWST